MFCRYWCWHSSYVTDIYEFLFWYLAPLLMTGNRLGTKQTWAITRQTEVFSHLQWTALQQCVQCWPESPSHHIETRHHHTRRFNAKWNTSQAMLDGGETRIWILGAWCETGPGWRWVVILQTWMEVRSPSWDLNGVETKISGNWWGLEARERWEMTWMAMLC